MTGKIFLEELIIDGFFEEDRIEIKFNRNLNIFTGKNGCGKTTVLKTINALLDFNIQKILCLSFSNIILKSSKWILEVSKKDLEIKIEISNKNRVILSESINLKEEIYLNNDNYKEELEENVKSKLSSLHSYIPLTRTYNYDKGSYQKNNYGFYKNKKYISEGSSAFSLDELIKIIDGKYRHYLMAQRFHDDNFKRKVLQVPFQIDNKSDMDDQINKVLNFDNRKISEIIRIYSELSVEEDVLKPFFDDLMKHQKILNDYRIKDSKALLSRAINNKKNSDKVNFKETFTFVLNNSKLEFGEKILELAKANKEIKKKNYHKFDLFLEILNDFFIDNRKKITFSRQREMKVENLKRKSNIELESLSSGEKQLITLFGYIVFNKNNIFMIDEPELSLHLDWQMKLSRMLLSINDENQYILATHSPEIVGKYRSNCIWIGEK